MEPLSWPDVVALALVVVAAPLVAVLRSWVAGRGRPAGDDTAGAPERPRGRHAAGYDHQQDERQDA